MTHPNYTVYCEAASEASHTSASSAWGAVVRHPDRTPSETQHGALIDGANAQVAELTSAIEALKLTPKGAEVHLVSTSEYLVTALKEHLDGWVRRNWRTHAGKVVAHETLWRKLLELRADRKIYPRLPRARQYAPETLRAGTVARALLHGRGSRGSSDQP
jgi:ribonuclease HI